MTDDKISDYLREWLHGIGLTYEQIDSTKDGRALADMAQQKISENMQRAVDNMPNKWRAKEEK